MRTIYIEKPVQQVEAVQYTGSNAADVVAFDPTWLRHGGATGVEIKVPTGQWIALQSTEWVIDDPVIGYVVQVSDESFRARFNVN